MRQTLDSVIAQSVRPAKWIIIDDGSTDETPHALAKYAARHDWIRIPTRSTLPRFNQKSYVVGSMAMLRGWLRAAFGVPGLRPQLPDGRPVGWQTARDSRADGTALMPAPDLRGIPCA